MCACEWRRDRRLTELALFAAAVFGIAGVMIPGIYSPPCLLISFYCLTMGGFYLFDRSVKLRVDDMGISWGTVFNHYLSWTEVAGASHVTLTRGVKVTEFLRVLRHDGRSFDINISRLDQPAERILRKIDQQFCSPT